MIILGFQKLTLLDFPNKVACTIFTGGCNFRCPFCHNALLVTEIDLSTAYRESEVLDYIASRKGLLDGVAITGGEPLLQNDIKPFIQKIKEMGFAVKLDTNGSFPDKLRELVNEKLVDYVAMDIKNSKEKYAETIGLNGYDLKNIEESVAFLKEGHVPYEFRTTIVKEFHTVEDVGNIAAWLSGAENYFLQNFEDSGNLIKDNLHAHEKATLEKMRETAGKVLKNVQIRGI